jgi:aminoglycoside 3'-phosphotransferase-2
MTAAEPTENVAFPPVWQKRLQAYRWHRHAAGLSGADVFRLEAPCLPTLFVKVDDVSPFSEVAAEAPRLAWLSDQNLPCPQLLGFEVHAECNWLLASAVPGRDLAAEPILPGSSVIDALARALSVLHAASIDACPFDHRLAHRLAQAAARVEAGAVDTSDIGEPYRNRPPAELFALLMELKPAQEDLVVTHGDACLANILVDAWGTFTGFVDCGRLGVADRAQDLALACRSIEEDFDPAWVEPFLARYGSTSLDPRRVAFYQLLDEFF